MKSNPTIRSFLNRKHTYKEVFDYVRAKVNEQGNPSVLDDGRCVYRGTNGSKCAAGHLIPDKDLKGRHVNGVGILDFLDTLGIPNYNSPNENRVIFIVAMQRAHDGASFNMYTGNMNYGEEFLKAFNKEMDNIAKQYGLED